MGAMTAVAKPSRGASNQLMDEGDLRVPGIQAWFNRARIDAEQLQKAFAAECETISIIERYPFDDQCQDFGW